MDAVGSADSVGSADDTGSAVGCRVGLCRTCGRGFRDVCGRTRAVLLPAGMTGSAGVTCPWVATGRTACVLASVTIVALIAATTHTVTAAMAVARPGLALATWLSPHPSRL